MNTTITMTKAQKLSLENKAKVGWKYYYTSAEEKDVLARYFAEERERNKELIETLKKGGDIDIEFLKKQFIELYDKVGDLTDCPVCMETMTKANSDVGSCGHMICKICKDTICKSNKKECPICKKKYYVPN
jgi:hypothetical protein